MKQKEELINDLYLEYSYLSLDYETLENLVNTYKKESIIREKLSSIIKDNITKDKNLLLKYIDNLIEKNSTYKKELDKIYNFFSKLDYTPSIDDYLYILSKSSVVLNYTKTANK